MNIHEISHLPTLIAVAPGEPAIHESCGRATSIIWKVKDLLKRGCPNDILLELIEVMEYRNLSGEPHVHIRKAKEAEDE